MELTKSHLGILAAQNLQPDYIFEKETETGKITILGFLKSFSDKPNYAPAPYTDLFDMPIWQIQFVLETKTDGGTETVILFPKGDKNYRYSVTAAKRGDYDKKLKFCLMI